MMPRYRNSRLLLGALLQARLEDNPWPWRFEGRELVDKGGALVADCWWTYSDDDRAEIMSLAGSVFEEWRKMQRWKM